MNKNLLEVLAMAQLAESMNVFPNRYTYERDEPKISRNEPCSCGSGKKYKKCCLILNTGGERKETTEGS